MGYARPPCPGYVGVEAECGQPKALAENTKPKKHANATSRRSPAISDALAGAGCSGARLATSSTAASFTACSHSYWRPTITASAPRPVCDC